MTSTPCDLLIRDARIATMASEAAAPYGLIEQGVIAITNGRLAWVGDEADMPTFEAAEIADCEGRLITPGLIDCHTHLVWGGDRIDEFEARLAGTDYAEIARRGGGINASVRATREASAEALHDAALPRLARLMADGVTRVEIKSGYGLDTDTEMRMLTVARRLGQEQPVTVHTTFLGAHAVPPAYAGRSDAYIDLVVEEMLPAVAEAGLADAVDAFLEHIAFSPAQVERVFEAARRHGLPVKLHAEQLSNLGGARLAARFDALSADHLEYLDEEGVRAMADAGTTAVLLPGAFFFLRERQAPPVALLRRYQVPIALATDLNPGSSPLHSVLATLTLGCVLFGLTPEEALAGVTRQAARALGVADTVGTVEAGKQADLAVWDTDKPAALVANLGLAPCIGRYVGGRNVGGRYVGEPCTAVPGDRRAAGDEARP